MTTEDLFCIAAVYSLAVFFGWTLKSLVGDIKDLIKLRKEEISELKK